jgi:hypothetical protein
LADSDNPKANRWWEDRRRKEQLPRSLGGRAEGLTPADAAPTLKRSGGSVALDKALIIQLAGSAAAVGLLVALAAWARIARPTPPLDAEAARALLAVEFPDDLVEALWVAADGAGLVARSGERALVFWRKGDGYVARDLLWAAALAAKPADGLLVLETADGAVRLALKDGEPWPPPRFAAREAAA